MTEELKTNADSTYLRPTITTIQQLKDWVTLNLGGDLQTVELSDEQLNAAIQNALEKYTKYATFDTQDIIVDLNEYEPGNGLDLSRFNIAVIKDISFKRDQLLAGYGIAGQDCLWGFGAMINSYGSNGMLPFFNSGGNATFNWVSLHALQENLELVGRMTGSMPQYRYYSTSKRLVLTPAPHPGKKDNYILITCEVEPPIEELLGNEYVKRLTLAYSKIILGNVRKKFQNVQLLGGGTVDTSIGDEGREELDKLLEEIRSSESFGNLFVVSE